MQQPEAYIWLWGKHRKNNSGCKWTWPRIQLEYCVTIIESHTPTKNTYYFLTIGLLRYPYSVTLQNQKFFCLETVRSNRLRSCNLPLDKDIKKKARGAHIEKECKVDHTTLRAIKWLDTKAVTFLISFDPAHPVNLVERYDRSSKRRIEFPCPKAVSTYNKHMGVCESA